MVDLLETYVAIFEVDMKTGVISWASRALEEMFGYRLLGDLEGRSIDILVPDVVREKHKAVHRPAFETDPIPRIMGSNLQLRGRRRDGTEFPVEVMLLLGAENLQRVVVGVVLDLSGRSSV
jgi:PAS domain S-box-containing protein